MASQITLPFDQWVSVTDSLPPLNEKVQVVVFSPFAKPNNQGAIQTDRLINTSDGNVFSAYGSMVKYWQPLNKD